ncbi:hypothetical protein K4K55_002987 [Colletotrichum sp. SAR 10_96]|nr:hypothetical protein K4K55_002987 [Colletotrichum sp. SAR 10_96]
MLGKLAAKERACDSNKVPSEPAEEALGLILYAFLHHLPDKKVIDPHLKHEFSGLNPIELVREQVLTAEHLNLRPEACDMYDTVKKEFVSSGHLAFDVFWRGILDDVGATLTLPG